MTATRTAAALRCADLHVVVRIGEGMREVVRRAREVNIAALNARLASRRQGERALGFAVAATALREVAGGLTEDMDALTAELSAMVHGLATRSRQARTLAHFGRAAALHPSAATRLDALQSQCLARLEAADARLHRRHAMLARRLAAAQRRCESGLAITRSATIEAAHGGTAAAGLALVARQLAATLQAVSHELAGVQRNLGGGAR